MEESGKPCKMEMDLLESFQLEERVADRYARAREGVSVKVEYLLPLLL